MSLDNQQISALRRDRHALVAALTDAGGKVRGNTVKCPWHDDKTPSGSIWERDGIYKYTCHTCNFTMDVWDIKAKILGTECKNVLPATASDNTAPKPKETFTIEQVSAMGQKWIYNRDNAPYLVVIRCTDREGKKTYKQLHAVTENNHVRFAFGAPPKPWPLYNLALIQKSTRVIVCEGEKAADAVTAFGWPATTAPGGAGNAHHADWSPLAGKTVYLWPDNDKPGLAHMQDVADILRQMDSPPTVNVIDPSDLPPKGDAADVDRETARNLLNGANEQTPGGLVVQRLRDMRDGRWVPAPLPWRQLHALTRALLPGTLTLLCGAPGSSKSLMTLDMCRHWLSEMTPFSLYALEEDATFHLHRALAQHTERAELLNERALNDDLIAEAVRNKNFMDQLAGHIFEAPRQTPTLEELAKWVRSRAEHGDRVIVIDPLSVAQPEQKQWIADQMFIMNLKSTLRDYPVSVVLIMHPKKGPSEIDLDSLSGGAAYQRLAQTVLWLEHTKDLIGKFRGRAAEVECHYNRLVHVLKARNALGQGAIVGYEFSKNSLRFTECGVLVQRKVKTDQGESNGA